MKVRVLVVDDNADDRLLVVREVAAVEPEAEIVEADRPEPLAEALAAGGLDLAVVDYALRWGDGIEVTRRIRAADPATAVVMFTGSGNEEVAVEAMKAGLDDYVPKGTRHLPRLRGAWRSAGRATGGRGRAPKPTSAVPSPSSGCCCASCTTG